MKNKSELLLILFLFLFQTSFAQKYDCGWYGKKTVEERNKIFPFNKAKKIVLIAFPGEFDGLLKKGDNRSYDEANGIIKEYKVRLDTLEFSYKVKEEVVLDEKGRNEISNILINHKLKKIPKGSFLVRMTNCYVPRNAILFFDENDEALCYYEICFQCWGTVMNPDPADLNKYSDIQECHGRLDIIKDFFSKNGIKYGVEERK
jgi:hypothetical protein